MEKRVNLKLPDDLHARAKAQAAKERKTLQTLLQEWVAERLEAAEKRGSGK